MMEFYSGIMENEISSWTGERMELENINLSEVNQVQNQRPHVFSQM
jgi:hypothetical protein